MSARWEAAQRAAADPAASVFVTANAGSGKTKVLVDRIARLLLEGSRPSSFLCVTYTKAAAAEMQRRLFERLGAWCVADNPTLTKELADLEGPDAPPPTSEQLAKARALFARALETPGGLKIQTIHAFCERLLARFPLEAGVPPGFDIADEPRAAALLARARADCILRADDKLAEAFARFAERLHGEALEGFMNRLALRRADFRGFSAKHLGELFAEAEIKNRHGAKQSSEDYARAFVARVNWARLGDAVAVLRASGKNDCKTAERIAEALSLKAAGWPDRAVTEAVLDIAFKDDGEPYKSLITKSLAKEQGWVAMLLDDLSEQCVTARTALNAMDRAEDAAAALALALKLDGAYEAAKIRAGVLDFDDLIAHAQALLSRSAAAPWVLYKLDGGLDHILIDEGQDTSPSQWELIAPLMDEFFAGGGAREAVTRTVFAVGDPKQSIYAFQGADPDRFLREDQALEKRARKAKRKFTAPVLETSFRSSPEILALVDQTFADKELAPGAPEKFNEVRHIAARESQGGLVELWPINMRTPTATSGAWDAPLDIETEKTPQAVLAKAIAKRARQWVEAGEGVWDKSGKVLRPIGPGDILALVRTRGGLFRELIKAFKREGFPVAGADRMILRDELAVEDCLALMRVALDPADDLALACVLKGPWCDLIDDNADLFPLAYGRGKETLHARLMANADEKYAAARAFVSQVTERGGADPFSFLSWALETPHGGGPSGWARVFARLGAETRDPLEELLQRAVKGNAFAAPSLQRFLHDIEVDAGQVKRELEAAGGAVRVMTVHGAKGLEAPIVVLPDCTGPVSDKPEDGLMFEGGAPFVSFRRGDDDAAAGDARAEYQARMLGEHWRLLYVALTRARDRLIVCGAQHGNATGGAAANAWRTAVEEAMSKLGATACETPFGEGLRLGAPLHIETQTAPRVAKPAVAKPTWISTPVFGAASRDAAKPSGMKLIDPLLFSPRADGAKRFRRGKLIHGLLERLPDVSPARRSEAARAWLKRQGVEDKDVDAFAREALTVIDDARFAAIFSSTSRAEAPIVGIANGRPVRGVVDRLAVDDGAVMVLDYKTDRPAPSDVESAPDAYVLQMALYREVLRKIFPQKDVRCALLWTEKPLLMPLPEARLDRVFEDFVRG